MQVPFSREVEVKDLSRAQVLLVTGISGAGRGTAARILEDLGWYVVDNVPVELIPQLLQIEMGSKNKKFRNNLAENPTCSTKNLSGDIAHKFPEAHKFSGAHKFPEAYCEQIPEAQQIPEAPQASQVHDILIRTATNSNSLASVANFNNLSRYDTGDDIDDAHNSDGSDSHRVAVVLDVRTLSFSANYCQLHHHLQSQGIDAKILFLEADDTVLIRRFTQARRRHPLHSQGSIDKALRKERELLIDWKLAADLVVDTTNLSINALRNTIMRYFTDSSLQVCELTIVSFGFKHGLPLDMDLLFDARFLPNPHWEEHLRNKTGLDQEVSDYVLNQPVTNAFLQGCIDLLMLMVPGYLTEGKNYITCAIGCTGGKHRSVALVEELGRRLAHIEGIFFQLKHRDIGLE